MAGEPRVRIGDLLVQKGLMSEEQLMQALSAQKKSGKKIVKQEHSQGILMYHREHV